MKKLTQKTLKKYLRYEENTGLFFWLIRNSNRIKVGDIAGHKNETSGYVEIRLLGSLYYAHILASVYVTGEWPSQWMDHKDTDKTNNRWLNIRQATASQNGMNKKIQSNNRCGVKGVAFETQTGRYRAEITVKGKKVFRRRFDTLEEAAYFRTYVLQYHHGEFARAA